MSKSASILGVLMYGEYISLEKTVLFMKFTSKVKRLI